MSDTPAEAPSSRSWLSLDALAFPLALFVCTRLAWGAIARWSLALDPNTYRHILRPGFIIGLDNFCIWDCGWYATIAREGYTRAAAANFFPLLPLLGRAVSSLGLPIEHALILVSNVASLLSLVILYRLFRELTDEASARQTLLLLAAFPFAFFQAGGFAEALMVLATSLAVLLAFRGRHLLAGIVLGVGFLDRHLALAAGLALLVEQWRQRPSPARFLKSPAILGLAMPFVVALPWFVFLQQRFGGLAAVVEARDREWGLAAHAGLYHFFTGRASEPQFPAYVLFSLLPVAGTLLLLRERRFWPLAAFSGGLMAVVFSVGLFSLGRYCASAWPAFLPLGVLLARRPWLQGPVLLVLAACQGLFLAYFARSYPVN
jgi:hypothetical protein